MTKARLSGATNYESTEPTKPVLGVALCRRRWFVVSTYKNGEQFLGRSVERLTFNGRPVSTRVLLAIHLLAGSVAPVRISRNRNGRGRFYSRLRHHTVAGQWQAMYLGNLNTNDEKQLRDRIAERWPVTRNELCRTIRILRAHRRQLRQRANKLAAQCGYGFRGWMLHRRTLR